MGRRKGGGRTRYAVYKGDSVVGVGTACELAAQLGVTPETVRWWSSPANKARDRGSRKVAERI